MSGVSYLELLRLAVPETILVLTVLVVLAADLFALRGLELRFRLLIGAMISCVGCAGAIAWMLALPQHANFLEGMLVVTPLTQFIKVALLVLTILTIVISVDTDFTTARGGILRPDSAGGSRDDVPGQLRGHPDDLYLAGTHEPLALHPDGFQQAQPQVGGSGAEVLSVRRHVGSFHLVRVEPALRVIRRDQPWPNRGGHQRPEARPAAGAGDRDDRHRLRLQGGRGAVPSCGRRTLTRARRRRARRSLLPAQRWRASSSSPG